MSPAPVPEPEPEQPGSEARAKAKVPEKSDGSSHRGRGRERRPAIGLPSALFKEPAQCAAPFTRNGGVPGHVAVLALEGNRLGIIVGGPTPNEATEAK